MRCGLRKAKNFFDIPIQASSCGRRDVHDRPSVRVIHVARKRRIVSPQRWSAVSEIFKMAKNKSPAATLDLALLIGPDQKWLTTTGFLDKIDVNLKAAMAA